MKLDYLQFLELEVFTRFGSRLEAGMEARLRRGQHLREIFRQDRLMPLPIEFQLAWMIAFNAGLFDGLSPEAAPRQLVRLREGLERSNLTLENSREDWQQAVRAWCMEAA